jgi:hypothetical protein
VIVEIYAKGLESLDDCKEKWALQEEYKSERMIERSLKKGWGKKKVIQRRGFLSLYMVIMRYCGA